MAEHLGAGHEETARLEAALDRIWHAGTRRTASDAPSPAPPSQDQAELARRLDGLIAEIRTALGKDSAD
jgi:hypothetical protein